MKNLGKHFVVVYESFWNDGRHETRFKIFEKKEDAEKFMIGDIEELFLMLTKINLEYDELAYTDNFKVKDGENCTKIATTDKGDVFTWTLDEFDLIIN